MPKIPTIESNSSVKTGSVLGNQSTVSGIDSSSGLNKLGAGIQDFGRAMERIGNTQLALDARDAREKQSTNVAKAYSKLRLDWVKQYNEHQKNPTEDLLTSVETQYDDYVNKVLDGFETPEEIEAFQLKADGYKVGLLEKSQVLQQNIRAANFGANLDLFISQAEDSIYESKSLEEAVSQEELLSEYVESAVANGRIRDPETVQKLQQRVQQLSYTWAVSVVDEQPEAVLAALKQESLMDGVSAERREALKRRAELAVKEQDEFDKNLIRKNFNNDKAQRRNTGTKGAFNYEEAEQAFGKTTADMMQHDLELSSKLYSVDVESQGAYTEDLLALRERARPVEGSANYEADLEYFQEVEKIVGQRQQAKLDDPFSYFSQNSSIKTVLEAAASNPDNRELQMRAQEAVLEAQRKDPAIPPSKYAVMPKAAAKGFVDDFNTLIAVGSEVDGPGVRDQLASFYETFGENAQIAFRQLSNISGGEKVVNKINPLLWHLNNPSSFNLILNAVRKPIDEQKKRFTSDQLTNLNEDFVSDPNLLNYTASVFTADSSAQSFNVVNGVRESYHSFVLDYVANGGSIDEASQIFFSRYTFGEANGATYARPRVYQDEGGKTHVVDEKTAELSDEWLKNELINMSRILGNPGKKWNPSTNSYEQETLDIDPATVLPVVFEDTVNEDMADAIDSNGFWVTNEDETGVYLYVKGAYAGAPVQVRDTSGNPIEIPFYKTYQGRNNVTRRQVLKSRTDDSMWDTIGRTLQSINDS